MFLMVQKVNMWLEGVLSFQNVPVTIELFVEKNNKLGGAEVIPFEARLIDNPECDNQILLYDAQTDYEHTCAVRVILDSGGRLTGHASFSTQSGIPQMQIVGTYVWRDGELLLQGFEESKEVKEYFVGRFKKKV
jgi:hypothetical protein